MTRTLTATAVTTRRALLAESPVWDASAESLLWVDILRGEVHLLDPETGDTTLATLDMPVGAVAPRAGGGQVLAAATSFWLLDADQARRIHDVSDRGVRMNDGKCDPGGRFWAGTMTADRRPGAALYCLDPQREVRQLLDDVALSNGLGWSPDAATMYYVDTPTRRVDAFTFDAATGDLADRRVFVDLSAAEGNPDGLTVDCAGGVWVAMAKGGAVRRYTVASVLDMVVELPVRKVTSCTFGGPDLEDLYITTSAEGLSGEELAAQPQAGLLFRCRPGVTGLPAHLYAG